MKDWLRENGAGIALAALITAVVVAVAIGLAMAIKESNRSEAAYRDCMDGDMIACRKVYRDSNDPDRVRAAAMMLGKMEVEP